MLLRDHDYIRTSEQAAPMFLQTTFGRELARLYLYLEEGWRLDVERWRG